MTEEIDLREILGILWKRLWIILVCVTLASGAAGVISYVYLTPIYEASTKLIVNKTTSPSEVQAFTLSDVNLNIRMIDTYREVIKTHAIMDVVATENPDFELSGKQLIDRIRVNASNNSLVMTLTVEDASYEKAAAIVNAVSNVFQREAPNLMNVDQISILNAANPDAAAQPVRPRPLLNIAIAFVVSFMLGVGIIFLIEYLDDTIKNEKEVEQLLGLPTLAMITKIKPEDLQDPKRSASVRQAGEQMHGAYRQ